MEIPTESVNCAEDLLVIMESAVVNKMSVNILFIIDAFGFNRYVTMKMIQRLSGGKSIPRHGLNNPPPPAHKKTASLLRRFH